MSGIIIKNQEQIDGIRKSSKLAAETLDHAGKFVKEGISTKEIDDKIDEIQRDMDLNIKNISTIEEEIKTQDLWMIAENHPVLEVINNEMGLTTVAERMENGKPANSENTENLQAVESEASLKTEHTVFKQVYNEILSALKIEEDELLSLADERAFSVKQYLVDDLKLSHERISVIKSRSSDLSGRIIELGLDVM